MQALEFIVDIVDNNRIFMQLPETLKARKAKAIDMYKFISLSLQITSLQGMLSVSITTQLSNKKWGYQ